MSRESLIYALNNSLKSQELPDANTYVSRFDASTGTFYCGENRYEYGQSKMREAEQFFKVISEFYKNSKEDSDNYKKAEFCEIARTAIKFLIESQGGVNNA